MTTTRPKKSEIERKWYVVDATDKILGRMATTIADKLRGKDKTIFTPDMDCGDFVIVTNSKNIMLKGNDKINKKKYYTHSGYPGALKEESAANLLERNPTKVVELAVKGMLPRNRLRKEFMKKLKIYPGAEHPHQAQNPQTLDL